MKKSKKEIILTLAIKICLMRIEKEKEYMKDYYYKRKILLHYLLTVLTNY